ncbi:hypothetical protein CI109_102897 [Kwoniella shandongensis]|uniref:E2 ubiquitin-conjugating enzyme n=1 Tax=Kwoniella shandongensis TaxID=1734106 RepID=A0A5M6C7Y0_9TREE|nr:uncharacterized protein CI109_000087 [Kwoniella shandongensis]KAA5531247.1 hypothetical protein CI109_000087 [Kwoniella shandongensis]
MSNRRIQKELAELLSNPPENITVIPDEANLYQWQAVFKGPPGTPYAKGKFTISIAFNTDYPFKPPLIQFKTKMWHPNIDSDGNICIGLLKTENWKPATKMLIVLMELYNLIKEPNPDDPLVSSIADQYRTDRKAFDKKVTEYVSKFAS